MSREPTVAENGNAEKPEVSQLAVMWLEELEASFAECYGTEKKPVEDKWPQRASDWVFWECFAGNTHTLTC